VGSLGLSDATMRNAMADLEYLGYIDHPHTSAGRTPTDKGYRLYVNDLMSKERPTDAERKAVARSLAEAITAEDIVKESSFILSKLSRQLSMVLLPSLEEGRLERVDIAKIASNRILIILASSSGRVRTVTLETETTMEQSRLDELRTILNERLAGRTFREIKATFRERTRDLEDHARDILRVFIDSPEKLFDDAGVERVRVTGARQIFSQPEFQKKNALTDAEFQSIIELIDNEEVVIHILEQSGELLADENKAAIRIGSELAEQNMTNYSLICTTYKFGDQKGIVGLIGPKRMDYARIAPLVEHVSRAMSNVLAAK
jgi:heat-inducible transcriptional repressor